MSADELKVKIDCGAVLKELDPTIPSDVQDSLGDKKIFRFRFTQQSGKTTTATKRVQEKRVEAEGDEAPLFANNHLICFRVCDRQRLSILWF